MYGDQNLILSNYAINDWSIHIVHAQSITWRNEKYWNLIDADCGENLEYFDSEDILEYLKF